MNKILHDLLFKKRESWILPIFRIIYPLCIAITLIRERDTILQRSESVLCHPIELLSWLHLSLPNKEALNFLFICLIMSLFALSVGFFSRLFGAVSFFLFFYVYGSTISCAVGKNPDYIPWNHAIVVFNLFLLFISDSGRKYSLDALVFKKKSSFDLNWPIFLLKFNLIYAYFASAFAKLSGEFLWVNGYSLQAQMIYRHLNLDTPEILFLINSNKIAYFVSIVVITSELLSPLALINKYAAVIFVSGSLIFQIFFAWSIELRWMSYFGWAYLIYFFEVVAYLKREKFGEFPLKTSDMCSLAIKRT